MLTIADISAMAKKFSAAYEEWMQPLCKVLGLPFMAVSVLMYFANNPENNTAQQLCDHRGYKRAIVSMHIEKLVQRGYLRRVSVEGDRRKFGLVCTKKAEPFIEQGREYQKSFGEALLAGLSKEDVNKIEECIGILRQNIDLMNKCNI